MPSPVFDMQEALKLGHFVQAAYELFASGDPADFTPPDGYALVTAAISKFEIRVGRLCPCRCGISHQFR
jgi:hypothetical protein